MGNSASRLEDSGEEFWRRLILPVERKDRWWRWDGKGYRWFISPNIVPLEQYRTPVEMFRIRQNLLS